MQSNNHIQEYTLSNGLHVLLHSDTATPVVAVNVLYHVGSKDEQRGRTGMAHLLEHISFENGPGIENGGYDRHCTSVGGENNAFTTSDITNYYVALPSGRLELGLWLESCRMSGFAVPEEAFNTQRNVIIEEKRQTIDDVPYANAIPAMREIAYSPEHPYNWEPIGFIEDLDTMKLDDLRAFYEQYYAPSNATLTIAGNFDPDEAMRWVEQYFQNIPAGDPVHRSAPSDALRNTGARRRFHEIQVPFSAAFLGYHIPAIGHSDIRALELLTNIVADGESSRLYRALEYTQEIASETDCFIDDGEAGSMMHVYAVGQNETIEPEALSDGISAELREIVRSGVSQRELTKALNMKITDIVRSLGTAAVRAERIGYFSTLFDDPVRAFTEAEDYRKVTCEDIQRVAERYLANTDPNIVEYEIVND